MQRGDFKAGWIRSLEILRDIQVKNVDDRKQRMTLRDLLTMAAASNGIGRCAVRRPSQ